ncbi:MAG: Nif3-like dinuclear metal center hexameric protein [Candidatus Schekmanbacteria bacterium RBG_13_48_7]|uniref:GTP cyclohydrolase 1 type 2 homolog n=1 Tax=Candidatus Schekmanbacteria bacterium RBG_13_48_7 TaxID=1817878 RepID=A0A1F7RRC9_9BACT|nr:MAG: Nif3-like dinuclear metal center hexameric protein [Candidatus Schekmanbacteria bacterium RBG_13_48_7]
MPDLKKIVDFLDKELKIAEIKDSSFNGLQVENSGRIKKICTGVDASLEFYRESKNRGANLVICHHGLLWENSLKRITGNFFEHLSYLIKNDIALYACHLPLDLHPQHGNNIQICKALKLKHLKKFGLYKGTEIGFEGKFLKPMSYENFKKLVHETISGTFQTMDFGKKTIKSVAVVSGGAAGEIVEAGKKMVDVYLTGEPALFAYNLAREYKINAVFAGHYATEVFGVNALAGLLKTKFKLETECIDFKIPY